ncbi:MAG: threonylcarbamoyl-AMP synthase [Methanothermobacter sp.]|nr:threonylcarbamoyl-AMP synthase [Methanothermobacter sp.]
MLIRIITRKNPSPDVLEEAISVMEGGGIVIYPTDTIYGLGVNALDEDAVRRLFRVKGRSPHKPVSICVSRVDEIPRFSRPSGDAMELMERILPGPYTVVLERNELIPDVITGGSSRVGIRVPDDEICRRIAARFPVTATSANISGKPPSPRLEEIVRDLDAVDLVLDAGDCLDMEPSTVIDLTVNPPRVLRRGKGPVDPVLLRGAGDV